MADTTISFVILNADSEDEVVEWTGNRARAIEVGRRALDNGHTVEDLAGGARYYDEAAMQTITVTWDDIAEVGAACLSGHGARINWAHIGMAE